MYDGKKLEDIFNSYRQHNLQDWHQLYEYRSKVLRVIPDKQEQYKNDIVQMLDQAISEKDTERLKFCIAAAFRDGISPIYSDSLYKVILETWHNEHEDIVDIVREFKDDRFSLAFFTIAMTPFPYRQYDAELEATLRKCVHALKEINSKTSNELLQKIIDTNNPNVDTVLEMYK